MAQLIVVKWRDIPAQVIVKAGRASARRQLSERFEKAIDMCAMRVGAKDEDAYLAEWRRSDPVEVDGDLEAAADKAAKDLESAYTDDRLRRLIDSAGFDA
jgi:translation initiation factor 2 alpha subunit (eIF-2alpha)